MYLATTIFLAIGAVNSQNNLLFWAFGLAIGGLLVSGVLSGAALMGVRLRRQPVRQARVGDALTIRYDLINRNRVVPAFCLTISESPSARIRSERPNWPGHFPQPRAFVVSISRREALTAETVVWPTRRGRVSLRHVDVSSAFPFGLVRKSVRFVLPAEAIVRPQRIELRAGISDLNRRASDAGSQIAATIGIGDDYFGIREYVHGDPLRHIAWRPSARTGTLVVRQTCSPSPTRVWIALDLAGSGASDRSRELAIAIAAAISQHAIDRRLAVALLVPGANLLELPRTGPLQLERILDHLALIDADAPPSRARPMVLPTRAATRETFVVVHAGQTDASIGPARAARISALRPETIVVLERLPATLRGDAA
ncbi:MAG: DUF58 domain-containing protein [Phycisphaeraceae bacterium]|nr:DUF58 domain-containing protein [Phycisphaeraceae bacterium]